MPKGLFDRLQHTLAERTPSGGLTLADLMALPSDQRQLVNWLTRNGTASWPEISTQVGGTEQAQGLLDALRAKGFVEQLDGSTAPRYQVRLAPRRKRKVPTGVWQLLTDKLNKEAGA